MFGFAVTKIDFEWIGFINLILVLSGLECIFSEAHTLLIEGVFGGPTCVLTHVITLNYVIFSNY